ncbi:MAG: ATP-dependent sacrificial sulfur transferase LarE [Ruminococcaceae bacterium]|nr:ATP-dependent sacrificial sulfur transferase LarE [Oscillospiraceae bacterium]
MTNSASLPLAVPTELAKLLRAIPRAALGFSGGVDSAYLLYACRACGVDVQAYYVSTAFQPAFELEDARRFAKDIGAPLAVLPYDILALPQVAANLQDRCYHCKKAIFGQIQARATADGYPVVMDGSNASDNADDRPGMRALGELRVCSPLREAGLTKRQVRAFSRQAGLFTWNKPAYACLATRVPTGTPLEADTLQKIEAAEDTLARLGFTDFRVRVLGDAGKLQLPAAQITVAAARHEELRNKLSPWFSDILLDLTPRPEEA